jgi:GAF domain-containing protein
VRLATAELPDTRSEAAIPLRSRGQVIGALTVQDSRPSAFDQATITVLQTMADQVAVALENARLFAESQQALDAERRAYGKLTRKAWGELLRTQADWGYRYASKSVAPAAGNWRPEMLRAAQSGQSVQGSSAGQPTLAIPIRVRDQVIGVLSFRKGKDGERWTAEETVMLETLTDQIGQALESARLHQETQQRATRERLTREITDNIRAAVSVEDAIQRAVREMGRALGASEMVVRLGSEQDLTSAQGGNGYE